MSYFSRLFFLFITLFILHFEDCHSATVVIDGVIKWTNPNVQIGDSVVFQHKYHYKLYIFQNQRAFSSCNFTQATLLTKPNSSSSYIWHPSRTGIFYFSFNNGSSKACVQGQKLAFNISLSAAQPPEKQAVLPDPPSQETSPPQVAGGVVSSSPAFPWPFKPRESNAPSPAPSLVFSATSPMIPEKSGIPFINSNPAVPLPTGEADSAMISPFPVSGCHDMQVIRILAVQKTVSCTMLLLLLLLL